MKSYIKAIIIFSAKGEKRIVTLKMTIVNQRGEVVIEGDATAMANKGMEQV